MLPSSRLGVEILEDRCVPAGNINAFISGDTLHIVGDQFDNRVQVWIGRSSVTINHIGGTIDDTLTDSLGFHISEIEVPRISIQTNAGDDDVAIVTFFGEGRAVDLTIDTGAGADVISFSHDPYFPVFMALSGNVKINTGPGNDGVYVDGAGREWQPAFGFPDLTFDVDLGTGNDTLVVVRGPIKISSLVGGNGHDDAIRLSDTLFEQYQNQIHGFESIFLFEEEV